MVGESELREDIVNSIIAILPVPYRVHIYQRVPREISTRFIRQWTGRTQDGVPFDVSHRLIYEISELPKEEVLHVYREAVLKAPKEDTDPMVTLLFCDGVTIDLCKNAIDIHAKSQPHYMKELLAILRGGELHSTLNDARFHEDFTLSYQFGR